MAIKICTNHGNPMCDQPGFVAETRSVLCMWCGGLLEDITELWDAARELDIAFNDGRRDSQLASRASQPSKNEEK